MSAGLVWVALAALLLGSGSVAQAIAVRRRAGAGLRTLLRDPFFALGTAAEGLGALSHVLALQTVSMAVAQCAISGSLVVTAFVARVLLGTRLGMRGLVAVAVLGGSLVALALVSGQTGTVADSSMVEAVLAGATALVGLVGAAAWIGATPRARGPLLAVVSGLGFAACSIAIRLVDTGSLVGVLADPAAIVAAGGGAIGALFWTLALRDAPVTSVTAIAVAAEVVPPSLLGPVLGDAVGTAFAVVAPLVLLAVCAASAVLARVGPGHAAEPAPVAVEDGRSVLAGAER